MVNKSLSQKIIRLLAKHKPKKIVYLEEYDQLETARLREKQIKGWTRAKKEKLNKKGEKRQSRELEDLLYFL